MTAVTMVTMAIAPKSTISQTTAFNIVFLIRALVVLGHKNQEMVFSSE